MTSIAMRRMMENLIGNWPVCENGEEIGCIQAEPAEAAWNGTEWVERPGQIVYLAAIWSSSEFPSEFPACSRGYHATRKQAENAVRACYAARMNQIQAAYSNTARQLP